MKRERFALEGSDATVTVLWQDFGILAKMVSVLVSVTTLNPSNPCVTQTRRWSQLSDLNRRPTVYKVVAPSGLSRLFIGISLLLEMCLTPFLPPA